MFNYRALLSRGLLAVFLSVSIFFQGGQLSGMQEVNAAAQRLAVDDTGGKEEILVKYKDEGKSESVKNSINKKFSNSRFKLKKKMRLSKVEVIEVDNNNAGDIIEELKGSPFVEYVQPNYKLYPYDVPSDDEFPLQWGLQNSGQYVGTKYGTPGIDINAVQAWDYTKGDEDLLVGVLDTGTDIDHNDLKDNIYTNLEEIPGNGLDDDGNGYTDDIHGWDFADNDNSVYDSAADDAHGTHVAGIIAAGANGIGTCGVAPKVKILPMKFLAGSLGGHTADVIEAIEYAKSMGVKIINCSWGNNIYNAALENEMRNSPDILFVCSAGNGDENNNGINIDVDPVYPSCYNLPNIITVASIDSRGNLSTFSNYGNKVDVAGPGEYILSTVAENGYDFNTGTSMAAPFVTGVAALLKSYKYGITPVEIVSSIKNSVKKLNGLSGKVSSGGMVNAYAALEYGNGGILYTPSPTQTLIPAATPEATPDMNSLSVSAGEASGHAGDTVTVPVNFSGVPAKGLSYCVLGLNYDKNVFEAVNVTPGNIVPESCLWPDIRKRGTVSVSFVKDEGHLIQEDGVFIYIDFKIKEGAAAGRYNIEFENSGGSFVDGDSEEINAYLNSGAITVLNAGTPGDSPTPPPTAAMTPTATATQVTEATATPTATITPTATPTPTATQAIIISIPDVGLRSAILKAIGRPSGSIYLSELENITELDAGREENEAAGGISDLEGIQYLKELKVLNLNNNRISNIGKLSNLKNLNQLFLSGNNISDISSLRSLVKLRTLGLAGNQINGIDALSGLYDLAELSIAYNNIYDISPLSGLAKLEYLDVYHNQIANIDILSRFQFLYHLDLSYNKINNISALSGLTGLYYLDLSSNKLNSISALTNMSNLSVLGLSGTGISNVDMLGRFTNLTALFLADNLIYNVSALSGLTKLAYLDLNSNEINDISVLSGFKKLIYLDLSFNQVYNIGVLSRLTELNYLNLGGNYSISDINVLGGLAKLEFLELGGNEISNISALYNLTNLKELGLSYNNISDINALRYLVNLESLYLNNNYIKNIEPLRYLTRLTTLYLGDNQITDFSPVSGYYYNIKDRDFTLSTPIASPTEVPSGGGLIIPTATPMRTSSPSIKPNSPTPTPTKVVDEPDEEIPGTDKYADIKGHWAEESIMELLESNIIAGYPDGTIRPNADITRAEITVLLCKAAGYPAKENPVLSFSDTESIPSWAKGYLQTAVEKGIVKGFGDNTFKASNKLTRKEIVVMALRTFGIGEVIGTPILSFKDSKQIPDWAGRYVAKAVELGIVKGYSDYTFMPDKNVSRAEAFTIIAKCMQLGRN